eukprot:GHVU01113391.1.p3 GENE.GHVU01113391.1~~GHVU01113391.1.p3  ORF type:complete len:198 (-),score=30.41 GHVU01113391.1:2522-3115(-)
MWDHDKPIPIPMTVDRQQGVAIPMPVDGTAKRYHVGGEGINTPEAAAAAAAIAAAAGEMEHHAQRDQPFIGGQHVPPPYSPPLSPYLQQPAVYTPAPYQAQPVYSPPPPPQAVYSPPPPPQPVAAPHADTLGQTLFGLQSHCPVPLDTGVKVFRKRRPRDSQSVWAQYPNSEYIKYKTPEGVLMKRVDGWHYEGDDY